MFASFIPQISFPILEGSVLEFDNMAGSGSHDVGGLRDSNNVRIEFKFSGLHNNSSN